MGNYLIKLRQSNRSNESGANKERNQTQWNGENSNGTSITRGPLDENQHLLTSSIFKMNVHCFDELFEYLSLTDLHSLSQTCKTMQQMTGEFFKLNYSGANVVCLSDGIYDIWHYNVNIYTKCIPIPQFIQFITSIEIGKHIVNIKKSRHRCANSPVYYNDLNIKFNYIKLHADELKSVKKLTLTNVCVNVKTVSYILNILPNIEMLKLRFCTVVGDLYDVLLKYCANVQHLQICRVTLKDNKWLLRRYEKLERLDLAVNDENTINKIDELCSFFELNPNVRSFSSEKFTLWSNKDALLNSKVNLDTFELKQYPTEYVLDKTMWDLLRQLHTHGFYKCLHTNGFDLHLNSRHHGYFAPLLRKIFISDCEDLIWVSNHFIECNEIAIRCGLHVWSNEIFVSNMEHPFEFENQVDILQYIQQMKNLKKIKLFDFKFEAILNLEMLNTEREKLAGSRKVTIYVPDAVYLATKWATKNGTTNFSLIEMKRIDSYEWNSYLSDWWMENLILRKKKNSEMLKF